MDGHYERERKDWLSHEHEAHLKGFQVDVPLFLRAYCCGDLLGCLGSPGLPDHELDYNSSVGGAASGTCFPSYRTGVVWRDEV
jgi:hypothetical protein